MGEPAAGLVEAHQTCAILATPFRLNNERLGSVLRIKASWPLTVSDRQRKERAREKGNETRQPAYFESGCPGLTVRVAVGWRRQPLVAGDSVGPMLELGYRKAHSMARPRLAPRRHRVLARHRPVHPFD